MTLSQAQANVDIIVGSPCKVPENELHCICTLSGEYQELAIMQAALTRLMIINASKLVIHNLEKAIGQLAAKIKNKETYNKAKLDYFMAPIKKEKKKSKMFLDDGTDVSKGQPPSIPEPAVSQYADYIKISELANQMAGKAGETVDKMIQSANMQGGLQGSGNGWLSGISGLLGGAAASALGDYTSYENMYNGTVTGIGSVTVDTKPFIPSTKPLPEPESIKVPEEVKGRKFRDV